MFLNNEHNQFQQHLIYGFHNQHRKKLANVLNHHNYMSSSIPNSYYQVSSSPRNRYQLSDPLKSFPHSISSNSISSNDEVMFLSKLSSINQFCAKNSDLTTNTTTCEKQPISYHHLDNTKNCCLQQKKEFHLLGGLSHQPILCRNYPKVVDKLNEEELKKFALEFRIKRISLGITQSQVGESLRITEGPSFSQSTICRLENQNITPKSVKKLKPILEKWIKEAELSLYNNQNIDKQDLILKTLPILPKIRRKRTVFNPQALKSLNNYFKTNQHPSGSRIITLAQQLGYEKDVVRVWFCNKRQKIKDSYKYNK
uniref:POU domain protein n=1 Tax=Clastoptera arizonana TaxID=38151 RepID=A0A1B6C4W2_9HEMI